MPGWFAWWRWCVLSLLLALVACSSDTAGAPPRPLPADELSYELFSTTTLLTDADLAGLASAPDGTLTFANAPASLAHVEETHVILAGVSPATPQGLLRVVTRVKRDGNALVLSTLQAPLQLAFRKLHVKMQRDAANFAAPPVAVNDLSTRTVSPRDEIVGVDADASLPLDFLLFDADGDRATTSDQVGIRGSLGGGFHFGLSIDVDWGDVLDLPAAVTSCVKSLIDLVGGSLPDCSPTALLPELKLTFEADPHMNASASLYGAASLSYDKSFDLASIPLAPIPIGPLVFIPTVDVTAKVEGSAGAGFTVGAHGSIELQSSVSLDSKHIDSPDVTPIAVKKLDFAADDTKVVLAATAKVGVGARLNVELYGIVGPYAEAIAYAEVKADALADPCWSLHVGVDTALGVKVTSPNLGFLGSITLLDWKGLEFTPVDEVIASGACLPVEKGPPLPPGSGPDAVTYATPSFTPWARLFSAVGDDGAVRSFLDDGIEWTDDVLAIDGRYVAVGSRNDAIVKFDEAGDLIWSRRYRREPNAPLLRLRRVVPTRDAAMVILTEAQTSEPPSLLKIGQAGGVYFRKTLELAPDAGCSFEPFGLLQDTHDGFYVVAGCLGDERAAIVHVDRDANVLGVRLFGDPNPKGSTGNERTIVPSAIATMGDDVVVMGSSSTVVEGTRMFAIRLGDSGGPAWANRLIGCSDALDLHPSQARLNPDKQLTVVGTAADHRDGLVMRLKDDGDVAFANFSRFDASGDEPFGIHAFAELPTTGLLVAGSTTDTGLPAGDPGTETSIVLASLDAVGRTLWAKRYTLAGLRSMNHASLHVTDDGGALVTGITQHTSQPGGGLYAMKAFAKDGDLAGAPGVTVSPMTVIEPLACPVAVLPWPAVVTDTTATTTDVPTLDEDGAVHLE
jgi:hypothetical protein